jgi:hypothetical protein
MELRFSYLLKKFGPTRAEEITGVARVTQRDWRREGHLPTSKGMARYDLFDLCELWVLKASADCGYGPKRAKEFSRSAALHMAWWCLHLIGTYEGDHLEAPMSAVNKTFKLGGKTLNTPKWGRQSRWLADHILYDKDDPNPCSEFYSIWPDGQATPMAGEATFMTADFDKTKRGAVIVLPLNLAAHWLIEAAKEPLVQVSFGGSEKLK